MISSCKNDVTYNENAEVSLDASANLAIIETSRPSMNTAYAMAYDTEHKKIIIYGGGTGFKNFIDINETWEFDYKSGNWLNLNPKNSPLAKSSCHGL